MTLILHAKNELDAIGMTEDSDSEMNVAMRNHILLMIEEFSKEGHSGFSASYATNILSKLLKYEPLTPLTGEDSEWVDVAEVSGYTLYQNKRASNVFKENNEAYDINGIVFYDVLSDEDGKEYKSYYTDGTRSPVLFPYTPTTVYKPRETKE